MGRHQSRVESRLLELLNAGENANKCGECGSTYPTWASCNLGIFLCGRCASIHRKLGSDVSRVKSLSLDNWSESEVDRLALIGNKRAKAVWNPKKIPFPLDDEDSSVVERYFKDKYIEGKFRYDPIDPREYDERGGNGGGRHRSRNRRRYSTHNDDDDDDYGNDENDVYGSHGKVRSSRSSRSRSSMGTGRGTRAFSRGNIPPPRLSHRTPSLADKQKFYLTSYRLSRDTGIDQDLIIEALSLTAGDSKLAMEAVQLDIQYGGSKDDSSETTAPPLPRRRENLLMSDKTGVQSITPTSAATDWISTSPPTSSSQQQQQQQLLATITGVQQQQQQQQQPQLQPFMDQATGMVVYVDPITGQQYVDQNGAMQLQLLQQQQLQQQYTSGIDKGTIMSLYQRPDLYSSLVAMSDAQKMEILNQLQLQQLQYQQLTQLQLQQLPMDQQQLYLQQQQQQQQLQMQLTLQQPQQQQQQGFWG